MLCVKIIDSARFMSKSLDSSVNNLADNIYNRKCKYCMKCKYRKM